MLGNQFHPVAAILVDIGEVVLALNASKSDEREVYLTQKFNSGIYSPRADTNKPIHFVARHHLLVGFKFLVAGWVSGY